ncbi:uncharacterized protein TNCT_325971 [Trichonephila clavata]|uniref:Chromo domain-containing protein n=1 Tax=Trichonephila clavata TaxID=2740835 RepID=A0A8X6IDA6_TRICU|nr:uncharacterized protein TNCT_325971 [Trichonephila clavata]
MKAEAIKGRFYAEELQKFSKRSDDYWHVEKVLKTKGSGRKKEYYVKWKGFDNRFNSWVKAAWMKKPSKTNKDNLLKMIARNLKRHYIIRAFKFNHKFTDLDNMHHEIFQHINFNLMQTGIGGAADFIFDFTENKVQITVQTNVELEFWLLYAPLLMRMLSKTKDVILTGKTLHVLQKVERPPLNEHFRVSITDKPTVPVKEKKTENLELEVGFYKTSEQLFRLFKHLAFNHLANNKVKMHIPDTSSVTFQDGLKDLLGFKNSTFYGGTHISDYQLELDGGITEIYVCSDIIESHFVGDTIAHSFV